MVKGLYVHIPFCERICLYCDFPKMVANQKIQDSYIDAIIKELDHYQNIIKEVNTVYIGGGTPSHLSLEHSEKLLKAISLRINTKQLEEFSIEANPNDITEERLSLYKKYNVNRISVGVQTTKNESLELLHRTHDFNDIQRCIETIDNSGIDNYNLDFIYALPKQGLQDVVRDLDYIERVKPDHISYYSLIVEEKTELMHQIRLGHLEAVDDDLEADMQDMVLSRLKEMGYERYEISNFALNKQYSHHNLLYWNLQEYLGIGMAAASQYCGKRFVNPRTLKSYLDTILHDDYVRVEEEFNPMLEFLLMGLRKTSGVSVSEFERRFSISLMDAYPQLQKHLDNNFLSLDEDRLRFTEIGMNLSNQVYTDII